MAKTFSLSFPNDEAQRIELEAEKKGVNPNQLLRDLVRDRLHASASPTQPPSPHLQEMTHQMQQVKEQLEKMQHLLQNVAIAASPQTQMEDALQPVSGRLGQVEGRIGKLCEAMEKLAIVLESDRALVPTVINRHEGFLEAIYVLVEKVLMYTSPEELRATNQKLIEEMHTQLEKLLND